jgi:Tol biopolymer transport system component
MRYAKIKVGRVIAFMCLLVISGGGIILSSDFRASAAGATMTEKARVSSSSLHTIFHPASSLSPTQPGANGKIAFTSLRNGNAEIYTMNADGSNQVNLTKNPAMDATPVWSPDGSRIAFTSDRSGRQNIYVMNADGSNVTKITKNDDGADFRIFDPAWSPDGTKLVYIGSLMGELSALLVVNADGSGATTRLDQFATEDNDPEWSPDGTRIAFTGREAMDSLAEGVRFYLFVMNADGSGKTRIADWPLPFTSFFFHTDGSGPTWSPDGTQLAYSYDNKGAPAGQPRRVADILVVKAGGGAVKFLTETSAEDTFPSWSPDSSRIAFTSNRDGHKEIYVMNADGSQQTRLTNTSADSFDPNWQTFNPQTLTPVQSTIQFRASSFRVRERLYIDHTEDPLVVTRLGDLSQEATVDFTTSSACAGSSDPACTTTASERSDYITSSGTLHFAPGEGSKNINVPIIDDAYVEPDESFNVSLSNATGATLGGQQTATVTILDNDTSPPGAPVPPTQTNPIDIPGFFLRLHYLDFLNREPDPEGFAAWQNTLSNCSQGDARCDRIEVSSGFFRSTEFQVRGYFVYRFYSVALGRKPDFTEFMPDLRRVTGFITDQQLEANKVAFINDFMARSAFHTKYDSTVNNPTAYVDTLLQAAALPSHPSRAGWIAGLTNGTLTRAQVLRELAESGEVYQKYYNQAFVVMQYFGYLRRDPDILYLDWIKTMDSNGGDYRAMITGFVNSLEYRQRF